MNASASIVCFIYFNIHMGVCDLFSTCTKLFFKTISKEHEIFSFFHITFSQQATKCSYHDSSEETHHPATAGAGRHIPIAHCEEGDGYEPQSHVHVACRLGLPAGRTKQDWDCGVTRCVKCILMDPTAVMGKDESPSHSLNINKTIMKFYIIPAIWNLNIHDHFWLLYT